MLATFSRSATVLLLALTGFSLSAQTSTGSPAFSFSPPQKVLAGSISPPNQGEEVVTETALDINKDGNTDLVLQANNGGWRGLLIGDGKGGFTYKTMNFPTSNVDPYGNPYPLIFVDLNHDGRPDLLGIENGLYGLQGQQPACGSPDAGPSYLDVELGDGQGNFKSNGFTVNLGSFFNINAVVGDFNNDGLDDIAVVLGGCGGSSPLGLMVLLNNGDGTLTELQAPLYLNSNARNFVKGDFNGDGKIDLAFVGMASNSSSVQSTAERSIQILYGNGDGTFRIGPLYQTSAGQVGNLLPGDLNGDGRTDLVTSVTSPLESRIVVLLAKQNGGLYWHSELGADCFLSATMQFEPLALGLIDLNHDGKLDLPCVSYDHTTNAVQLKVHPGLGGGDFGPAWLVRNLGPNSDSESNLENDLFAPLKTGGLPDVIYARDYSPSFRDVYVYEMWNQSK